MDSNMNMLSELGINPFDAIQSYYGDNASVLNQIPQQLPSPQEVTPAGQEYQPQAQQSTGSNLMQMLMGGGSSGGMGILPMALMAGVASKSSGGGGKKDWLTGMEFGGGRNNSGMDFMNMMMKNREARRLQEMKGQQAQALMDQKNQAEQKTAVRDWALSAVTEGYLDPRQPGFEQLMSGDMSVINQMELRPKTQKMLENAALSLLDELNANPELWNTLRKDQYDLLSYLKLSPDANTRARIEAARDQYEASNATSLQRQILANQQSNINSSRAAGQSDINSRRSAAVALENTKFNAEQRYQNLMMQIAAMDARGEKNTQARKELQEQSIAARKELAEINNNAKATLAKEVAANKKASTSSNTIMMNGQEYSSKDLGNGVKVWVPVSGDPEGTVYVSNTSQLAQIRKEEPLRAMKYADFATQMGIAPEAIATAPDADVTSADIEMISPEVDDIDEDPMAEFDYLFGDNDNLPEEW